MIRVDHVMQARFICDMSSDDNGSTRLMQADQIAHLLHLADIGEDGAYADDVVRMGFQFMDEAFKGWKIQEGTGYVEVFLDKHQTEGTMEHTEGKGPLFTGHLVMIKFHRVDPAAAVFIILGIRPEYACQKYSRPGSQRMPQFHMSVSLLSELGATMGPSFDFLNPII
jgi:hypothetical protein